MSLSRLTPVSSMLTRRRKRRLEEEYRNIVTFRTTNVVAIKEGNLEILVKGIKADEDGEIPHRDPTHEKARFMSLSRISPASPMMTRGRKRKLEEEYRKIFPILKLPNEILFQLYPSLDYTSRRALRVNGRLAEIEKKFKYRYNALFITEKKSGVWMTFRNPTSIFLDKLTIRHSDLDDELDFLECNTTFDCVFYTTDLPFDRKYINVLGRHKSQFTKIKKIRIRDTSIDDCDLESVVQNKEDVVIDYESAVTGNGLAWVYEKMRDCQLDLKYFVAKMKNAGDLWTFMERIGNFNKKSLSFTPKNLNQMLRARTKNKVIIKEGNLEIYVKGIEASENEETPPREVKHEKARFVYLERTLL